ncbi:hypothetical protein P7C73_g2576, partial [Tremellales sp. Uapishka_1]
MSTPKTMQAIVEDKPAKSASLQEVAVPALEANDVLVKVAYVAQNPTDWKHVTGKSPLNAIIGCDFSGTVVALGSSLKNPELKVGDKVAGTVHGGLFDTKGAFAEYLRVESDLTWKVPESISMEQASTFGVAWVTACQALLHSQKQKFPPAKVEGNPWFLIYGGSSSVGLFAIPLAKAMGYKVVAVASAHNHSLLESYGADAVVDYHDESKAVEEIQKITGGVERGLDTISEGSSFKLAVGGFGKSGGQLNSILPPSPGAKEIRTDVNIAMTLMYTLFGKEFDFSPLGPDHMVLPASAEDRQFHVEVCQNTPTLIEKYGIKANPINSRGTLKVIPAGLEEMQQGKVSGKKLVYKVAA